MPIARSYMCEDCAHQMTVTIAADQWDAPPPDCPVCAERPMRQEFKPVALGGSNASKARAIAEDIARTDYGVSNMQDIRKEGDQRNATYDASTWSGVSAATMQRALAAGRETRMNFGSGLDILQANIKSGVEPDLIANSKRRAMRVW